MPDLPDFNHHHTIQAVDLSCQKGVRTLFAEVSFSVSSGAAMQITGVNGIGKTSLLRILCGLSLSESGEIHWNGLSISQNMSDYRGNISYLGHKAGLKPDLSPLENLEALQFLRQATLGVDTEKLLSQLGIGRRQNRPCRYLSAGQRQRVGIARIALSGAPIWILDEPATSLDGEGSDTLLMLIHQHLDRKGLLIYTSHTPLSIAAGKHSTLELTKDNGR